jgi:hypothetical protein
MLKFKWSPGDRAGPKWPENETVVKQIPVIRPCGKTTKEIRQLERVGVQEILGGVQLGFNRGAALLRTTVS